jgi:cation:H+ antiporter
MYVPYIISVIRSAKDEHAAEHSHEKQGAVAMHFILAIAAIFGIIVSARIALVNGEKIGLALGISPLALGVILFAFGTSLPELAISLSATFKKNADVTIGEVYASNIFTQFVVLGICALIRPIDISQSVLGFAMPFLILAAITIQIFITTGRRLNRIEAAILLIMYMVFAATNFFKVPSLDTLIGW